MSVGSYECAVIFSVARLNDQFGSGFNIGEKYPAPGIDRQFENLPGKHNIGTGF